MNRKWEAEREVEKHLARELIEEQFPDYPVSDISLLGVGWDNTAYLVNQEAVFRFPRREIAVSLIQTEAGILQEIASQLPLQIPLPKWLGEPSKAFPWPFVGYPWIPGKTGCNVRLNKEEKIALASPLGAFLKALHSIKTQAKLPLDAHQKLNPAHLIEKTQKNLAELIELGVLNPVTFSFGKPETYRDSTEKTLVHGDLYFRHIILDEKRTLSAIIDWGDVHLGDPAVDLAIIHGYLPEEAHLPFKQAYGEISEETIALSRLRAIYSHSCLGVYGHHVKDKPILNESLKCLKAIAE